MAAVPNTAWAFTTAGEPASALLDPISILDVMEAQGTKFQGIYYQMSMYGLTATGCLEGGFLLSMRAEANGLLSHFHDAESLVTVVHDCWTSCC